MLYPKEKEIRQMSKETTSRLRKAPGFVNENCKEYLDDNKVYKETHEYIQIFV